MAQIFDISQANPFKFYAQANNWNISGNFYANSIDLRYNSQHIDDNFFSSNIKSWQDKTSYFAPWQTTDSTIIQFASVAQFDNYHCYLLDCKGKQVHEFEVILKATLVNGSKIYHCNIDFFDIPIGVYYIQLQHSDFFSHVSALISEPFDLQNYHENTMLFEYTNSYNSIGMIWNFLKKMPIQKRLHSAFIKTDPNSKSYTYQNQIYDTVILSGQPYRLYTLGFGGNNSAIPEYEADLINNIFCVDSVKIDGKYFTKNDGATLDDNKEVNNPLASYAIKVLQKESSTNVSLLNSNYAYIGIVPSSDNFYIGRCCGNVIENGFAGQKIFLAYLNSKFKRDNYSTYTGNFTINANNELFFISNDVTEIAAIQGSIIEDVLPHMISFDLDFSNQSPGTTTNYTLIATSGAFAWISNEGGVINQNNYTIFSGISPIAVNAATKMNLKIYLNETIEEFREGLASNYLYLIKKMSGDLPQLLNSLDLSIASGGYIENNIFIKNKAAFNEFYITYDQYSSNERSKLIIWLHECFLNNFLNFSNNSFLIISAPLFAGSADKQLIMLLNQMKETGYSTNL